MCSHTPLGAAAAIRINLCFPQAFLVTPSGLHTVKSDSLTSSRAPDLRSFEISFDTKSVSHEHGF